MDSTPNNRRTSFDDSTECNRPDSLAEILVTHHERILASSDLTPGSAISQALCARNVDDHPSRIEMMKLHECLLLLERVRRATASQNARHPSSSDTARTDFSARRIGRFEIERELGRGGLGVVLLAFDPILRRHIALKVPRPEALVTEDMRRRFQREAEAAARLTHPHIVPVYEVGEAGVICFITAEYIEGPNLGEWLKSQRAPIACCTAAALVADLSHAMEYAHSQGVLHRDLKPTNILIDRNVKAGSLRSAGSESPRLVAKITDFGLAKLTDQQWDDTHSGTIVGTPSYMSPEQANGARREVGPATDVYSLGAVLYELLTGKPPFRNESDAKTLVQVVSAVPASPRQGRPQIPRDLEAICLKCLEKEQSRRYPTAGELATDLQRYLNGEPTLARPLSFAQSLVRWARRRPSHAALVAFGMVALVAAFYGAAIHNARLDRALKIAEANESRAIKNKGLAERETQRANMQLYAAQMRMANQAFERYDFGHARETLANYDDGTPLAGLRGVEWHVLNQLVLRPEHEQDVKHSVLLRHPDEVYTVRFVPGTKLLVTGSQDGHIRCWDYQSHELVYDLKAHGSCVNKLRFAPDGTLMASASCDRSVIIWRLTENGPPEILHTLPGKAPMRSVEFSPDGTELAAGDESGLLYFWDPNSGQLIRTRQLAPLVLSNLSWSPTKQRMAISLYRHVGPDELHHQAGEDWQEIPSPHEAILAADLSYSPDGKRLAINDDNLRLRQFATDTWDEFPTIESEGVRLAGVAWSPDCEWLATIGGRGDIRIYDAGTGKLSKAIDVHNPAGHYEDITFDASGRLVASAARDGNVFITNVGDYTPPGPKISCQIPSHVLTSVHVDQDLKRLVVCAETAYREWNIDSGEMVVDRPVPTDPSGIRSTLAVGASQIIWQQSGQATLYDARSGRTQQIPRELATNVHFGRVLSESVIALACGAAPGEFYTSTLRVFDSATLRELDSVPCGPAPSLALSTVGTSLARATGTSPIELVDLHTGESKPLAKSERFSGNLVFSPDGRYIAGMAQGSVKLWNVEYQSLQHTIHYHSWSPTATFSPDGRTLAIVSEREVKLVHTHSGQEMATLPLPQRAQRSRWRRSSASVYFSEDGRRLAFLDDNRLAGRIEVYVWGEVR